MAEARSPHTDRLTPEGNRTGSPLRLTETGREIAKLTDAGAWSGRRAVEMKEDARGLEAWRVDELCKARVATDEGEMRTAMRKAAYEAGVAIAEVEAAVSLVLRNAVIDELAREGAWPHEAAVDRCTALRARERREGERAGNSRRIGGE